MSKIDIDKFVASLIEFSPQQSMKYIKALEDQGLKYKDGEIVEIEQESVDERIRKAIINTIEDCSPILSPEVQKRMIAWLEKQAPKPKWSEGDDAYKLFAISAVEDYYDGGNPLRKDIVAWLNSLEQRLGGEK